MAPDPDDTTDHENTTTNTDPDTPQSNETNTDAPHDDSDTNPSQTTPTDDNDDSADASGPTTDSYPDTQPRTTTAQSEALYHTNDATLEAAAMNVTEAVSRLSAARTTLDERPDHDTVPVTDTMDELIVHLSYLDAQLRAHIDATSVAAANQEANSTDTDTTTRTD